MCSYMQDREARGQPVKGTVEPGWQDLFAARASEEAASLQPKQATAAAGRRKLVPNGLPPLLHAACSLEAPFPLDQGDTVADDLEFCGRAMVTRNARRQRRAAARALRAFARELEPLN